MADVSLPSERHYQIHLRRMGLGLAFNLALGVAMTLALIRPGDQMGLGVPMALVLIPALVALDVALGGRLWRRHDPEDRRIVRDEWVRANMDRSRKIALNVVFIVQVPLMFFVAYLQPDPPTVGESVVGMAMLTMVAGSATFYASYLHYSRQDADG